MWRKAESLRAESKSYLCHGKVYSRKTQPHNGPSPNQTSGSTVRQDDAQAAQEGLPRAHENGREAKHGDQFEISLQFLAVFHTHRTSVSQVFLIREQKKHFAFFIFSSFRF